MRPPLPVAQRHAVLLARPPAVFVSRPLGEEPAEDAVLGVEGRDVVVDDHRHPLRRETREQGQELGFVEIVCRGEGVGAPQGFVAH